jgi:hypothetical protein
MLVGGDPAAVESYIERLRSTAGRAVQVAGVDKATLGNATGLLAGAASLFGQTGKFVQLHPDSVSVLKAGNAIPGTDGFFRMMTRGSDGKFLAQLQWKPTNVNPQQLMSAQMIAVQLALKSAIAEVEAAVRRVEGKVEAVLQLAKANRAGDVLGNNLTITRMVESLEKYGSLPDAYWDSVASLGPALNVTVEQLRNHVTRTLASFDPQLPVQERAAKLRAAIDDSQLGDTLSLLVVAEESLYKWQRLNLARIEATEPDQLLRAIDEARQLLRHQLAEDANVYRTAKKLLDDFAKPEAIEGFRFFSARELVRQRTRLREELDQFAQARRHQVESWEDFQIPNFLDAANETIQQVRASTSRALESAGEGLIRMGEYLAGETREKDAVVNDPPATDDKR